MRDSLLPHQQAKRVRVVVPPPAVDLHVLAHLQHSAVGVKTQRSEKIRSQAVALTEFIPIFFIATRSDRSAASVAAV